MGYVPVRACPLGVSRSWLRPGTMPDRGGECHSVDGQPSLSRSAGAGAVDYLPPSERHVPGPSCDCSCSNVGARSVRKIEDKGYLHVAFAPDSKRAYVSRISAVVTRTFIRVHWDSKRIAWTPVRSWAQDARSQAGSPAFGEDGVPEHAGKRPAGVECGPKTHGGLWLILRRCVIIALCCMGRFPVS